MAEVCINNIKCALSLTYIRGIAARCNCTFEEMGRENDGCGIDCTVGNFNIGRPATSLFNEIKIQAKSFSRSSKSMYKEDDRYIYYKLDHKIRALSPLFYLIVLELPEEDLINEWLSVDENCLILKKCAYYLRIVDEIGPGFIKIPKNQMFTPDSLPNLFLKENNIVELL